MLAIYSKILHLIMKGSLTHYFAYSTQEIIIVTCLPGIMRMHTLNFKEII